MRLNWPSNRFFQAIGLTSFTLGVYNAIAAAAQRQGNIQNIERIRNIGEDLNIVNDKIEKIAEVQSKGNLELKQQIIEEMHRKISNGVYNSSNPFKDQLDIMNQALIDFLKIQGDIHTKSMKYQYADPYTRLKIQNAINNLHAQAKGKIVQIHDAINSINPNLYVAKTQIQEFIEQLRRSGHNFVDSFYKYFEDFNNWISSLDYTQNIAFINLSGIFVILVTIISIIFIFYGNKILDYLNLEQRYPKIAKFIILRRKFQQYYLLWDIFIITTVSIVMFIMNLTLFI